MNFLKNKGLYRELFKLALPIALSSLVTFSVSFSDNMMISQLGNEATSAVYLCNQFAFLLTMLVAGIEATVLILSSHSLGADDKDRARNIASLGLVSVFLIASVFFVFSSFAPKLVLSLFTNNETLIVSGENFLRPLGVSFLFFALSQAIAASLRSVKKAKLPFFASFFALLLKIFLNVALIFGKFGFEHYGILGAGIATLAARVTEFSILFVYAFFIERELKLRFSSFFKIKKDAFKNFFKTVAPIILTQLVWSINNFFASAVMGREDAEVVAGLSLAAALYNLSYVVTNGMSGALGVLVGRMLGKADEASVEKLRKDSGGIQIIFIFLGVLTAVFMQIIKAPFISLWGIDASAEKWAHGLINVLSVMVIGTAYQSATLNGFIKASGDVRFVLKTEAFSVFCIIIPISLLASNLGASPIAVFAVLKCDQLLKCPIAFFKLRKFNFKNYSRRVKIQTAHHN